MKYSIKKNILGKYHILYNCPHCNTAVGLPADEAGLQIICPTCQQPLVAPGSEDLARIRETENLRRRRMRKRSNIRS